MKNTYSFSSLFFFYVIALILSSCICKYFITKIYAMMISNIFCLLLSFTFPTQIDTVSKTSILKEVTLYETGASVTRALDLAGMQNTAYVSIKDLPSGLDAKSMQVQADPGIEILSVQTESFEDVENTNTQLTLDANNRLQEIVDSLALFDTYISVLQEEKNLIKMNNKFSSSEAGVDIEMLKEAADLYRIRLKNIELEIFNWKRKIRQLNVEKKQVQAKLKDNPKTETKQGTEVLLLVRATNASSEKKIDLNYYIKNAGWKPYYDLRIQDDNNNINLDQKAYVYQKTGEDWTDVKLTITNSNPDENKVTPKLNSYHFYEHTDMVYYELPAGQNMSTVIIDESGMPLIGASVIIKGTRNGTITDIDGRFYLPDALGKKIVISYTGFITKEIIYDANTQFVELEEGHLLEEVVVVGSRNERSSYHIDGVRVKEKVKKTRTIIGAKKSESRTAINYVLEDSYTIPSTGKSYEVFIERKKIVSDFHYQVFPRLSDKAYLIASIADWQIYDLMSAPLNIFHNKTYKGKSYINTLATKDTLEISIGTDPEVVVQREQIKDYTKKNMFKNKIIEEVAWSINLKNNKRNKISVEILDQIPVSNDKSVKVELLEHDGANYKENQGFLDWEIELDSGESAMKRIIYKVKYEKDRKLVMI
jgi:hypothetical protein